MSSKRDREILNAIVNPLLPVGEGIFDDEEKVPKELKDEGEEDTKEFRDSRGLEKEAIKSAEEGDLIKSLELMNQAIKLTPQRASCFNNRAQIHRLNSDIHSALMDLDTTLQLTQGKGRSACQAFCQRGMIHRREGRNEEARQDFQKASEMGSNFAKSALTAMNPYAAMCNQMLKNVFQALEEGANQVEDPFKPQGTHRG